MTSEAVTFMLGFTELFSAYSRMLWDTDYSLIMLGIISTPLPVSRNHLDIRSVRKSLVCDVAEVRMCVSNSFISSTKVFVSNAKRIHLQRQKCLSPAQNAFVCSVIPYSEVTSNDYLIASDKCIHHLFGSWFRNPPPKEQKIGKKFLQNLISSSDGPEKKCRNKTEMKNARTTRGKKFLRKLHFE